MKELKPCPFCGIGSELAVIGDGECGWYVECFNCYATGGDAGTRDKAIDAWNKRAERTCKFVSSRGPDYPPACSACGHELDLYECEWFEDGTYGYSGNYCPHCGAKVVGSDETKEV